MKPLFKKAEHAELAEEVTRQFCNDIDEEPTVIPADNEEICIGDEVSFVTNGGKFVNGVVIKKYSDDDFVVLDVLSGSSAVYTFDVSSKTGRSFPEITEVLKKIGEQNE